MSFILGNRSRQNLEGVHPDLVKVVELAIKITKEDFTVIEGIRNIERQRKLLAQGFTKTLNSRHLTGHAVDICPYPIDWNDHQRFTTVSQAMKEAAQRLGVPIVWGGDWKSGWDKPHYELNRKVYPA